MVFSLSLLIPDYYRSTIQRATNSDVIGHIYPVMRWYFLKFLTSTGTSLTAFGAAQAREHGVYWMHPLRYEV